MRRFFARHDLEKGGRHYSSSANFVVFAGYRSESGVEVWFPQFRCYVIAEP